MNSCLADSTGREILVLISLNIDDIITSLSELLLLFGAHLIFRHRCLLSMSHCGFCGWDRCVRVGAHDQGKKSPSELPSLRTFKGNGIRSDEEEETGEKWDRMIISE